MILHWPSYILRARREEAGASGRAETEYRRLLPPAAAHPITGELAHFYRRTERLSEMEAAINQSLAAARPGDVTEFDSAALLLHAGRNFTGATQMLRHYVSQQDASERGPYSSFYLWESCWKTGKKKESHHRVQGCRVLAPQYKPARDALARFLDRITSF